MATLAERQRKQEVQSQILQAVAELCSYACLPSSSLGDLNNLREKLFDLVLLIRPSVGGSESNFQTGCDASSDLNYPEAVVELSLPQKHVPLDVATPEKSSLSLEGLPTETVGEVISFLPVGDLLCSIMLVSKQWRDRLSSRSGWAGSVVSNAGLPRLNDVRLVFMSQLWQDVAGLSLVQTHGIQSNTSTRCPGDASLSLFLERAANLQSLSLARCQDVTDSTLWALSKSRCTSTLRRLSLQSANVSEPGVRALERCTSLEYLSIEGCEDVGDTALHGIAQSCRRLRSVLAAGSGISDRGVASLASYDLPLKELDLSGTDVTDASLQDISTGCTGLLRLNISDTDISDDGAMRLVTCTELRQLNLRATRLLTDAAVCQVARHCTKITHLWLDWCDALTDASMEALSVCSQLKTLSLSHCHRITDQGVRALASSCRLLSYLDLSHCFNVTNAGIQVVARSCTCLQTLALYGCYKITQLGVEQVSPACNVMTNHLAK